MDRAHLLQVPRRPATCTSPSTQSAYAAGVAQEVSYPTLAALSVKFALLDQRAVGGSSCHVENAHLRNEESPRSARFPQNPRTLSFPSSNCSGNMTPPTRSVPLISGPRIPLQSPTLTSFSGAASSPGVRTPQSPVVSPTGTNHTPHRVCFRDGPSLNQLAAPPPATGRTIGATQFISRAGGLQAPPVAARSAHICDVPLPSVRALSAPRSRSVPEPHHNVILPPCSVPNVALHQLGSPNLATLAVPSFASHPAAQHPSFGKPYASVNDCSQPGGPSLTTTWTSISDSVGAQDDFAKAEHVEFARNLARQMEHLKVQDDDVGTPGRLQETHRQHHELDSIDTHMEACSVQALSSPQGASRRDSLADHGHAKRGSMTSWPRDCGFDRETMKAAMRGRAGSKSTHRTSVVSGGESGKEGGMQVGFSGSWPKADLIGNQLKWKSGALTHVSFLSPTAAVIELCGRAYFATLQDNGDLYWDDGETWISTTTTSASKKPTDCADCFIMVRKKMLNVM